ncbi:4Fe-4S dicluster domain-containing protein [Microvirga massiliensis]|uniref:4Fe-4S dicluster domain-containing protein n=1 Tax=Microvirga massiliensis TaxID=1033741 RepID=UPI00062B4480|nr:4Fe-4S dicluster domain-containing protein [Microvirga massiliensis]
MPPVNPRQLGPTAAGRLTRREALQALAASVTLAATACSKPDQEIVPYVRQPERIMPGEPLRFATTLPLAGYGRGVLAISVDGRPIKVEGNPLHPASLGATDVFAEATVLSLYDPDRSRTVRRDNAIVSWEMFLTALAPQLQQLRASGGEGLRLLTGRITSPTLLRQIDGLLRIFPNAVWHAYEPTDDAGRTGSRIAFGRAFDGLPHLDRADTVLCLDADPLGPGPDQIRLSRGWIDRRKSGDLSRVYVLESTPTLTGTKADERRALHPHLIHNTAIAVANALGAGRGTPTLPPEIQAFIAACIDALRSSPRRALVLAGRTLSAEAHALVHWINRQLDAPIDLIEPVDVLFGREPGNLESLREELEGGRVGALVIMGTNPAYDAPALSLPNHIGRVPFTIHLGSWFDETAALCHWHIPESHPLESWSDLRAVDGTASIVQPLIRPLYGTRTAHDLLDAMSGRSDASGYGLVRETWMATGLDDFDAFWRTALHDGVLAGSTSRPVMSSEPHVPQIEPLSAPAGLNIVLQPDPCVWDGRFANNAWLQECPKPVTKQVWGNALGLSPADAVRFRLATGDIVAVEGPAGGTLVPVQISPRHPEGAASLTIGYGRLKAGAIGNGVGADSYHLRAGSADWIIGGVKLTKGSSTHEILTTQNYVQLDRAVADLFPMLTADALARGAELPQPSPFPDFYRDYVYDGPAWAMVIDTAACFGCNACVLACQAENNVPVVGPEEIAQGRMMHWLRVDIYDRGTSEQPKPGFQPVPCMHCEKAPCEPVCPVGASVHDGEGLNVQVYNRCVGTRFCEANCPYKVRRFNFFGYADGQEYANLGAEPLKAQKNPEVTVRTRGVMEKCTYCIQRISRVRRMAERDGRSIADGEIVTACQAACPTRAITFGDLNAESQVRRLKRDARHYVLLGDLNTRPRTTYLADVRNPDPKLTGDS